MTYYGNRDDYQQQGQGGYNQGGHGQDGHEQGNEEQRRYGQGNEEQRRYGQGDHHQGGPQQGGYPQDRYQQDGPGLSQSYYSESSQGQQHQYPQDRQSGPGQYQQGPPSYNQGPQGQFDGGDGPDGERGVMGALAGGAAGAFGGHKMGAATGHNKTSTLVGALAGAFGGHKLQDAAEDWKDERDEKKDEEKRREEEKKKRRDSSDDGRYDSHHHRRRDSSSSRGSDRRRSGHYAGNFSASSRDIRLDTHGDYLLHASCRREDGDYQHTSLSLNKVLENDRGSFRWSAGGNHGASATVTVQQGDTLRGIAARFDRSFDEIARHNNINNPDLIYPGQTLQIPGGGRSGGGGFGSSARNVRLVDGGQRLEGELSRDGDWALSSIVLDERIRNFNGTLELI